VAEDPLAGGRAGARAGGPKGPDCFLIFVLGTRLFTVLYLGTQLLFIFVWHGSSHAGYKTKY
jgi:hypothetical protein